MRPTWLPASCVSRISHYADILGRLKGTSENLIVKGTQRSGDIPVPDKDWGQECPHSVIAILINRFQKERGLITRVYS